ncbi:MerR family transcriptional regulator [Clostridium akagii]|uniref:MerR family transcriptional regulator n=1 Tax=Clostridium akagii TaxID=91623 RepID=UPI00047A643F|nr:methyltransferase domain-containing protein [Clostridium akagii]
MNTKKVCNQFSISPKALRIYEDLDIIVPNREENNYRNYNEENILKLRQLILLKEMGIPLKNIKELLAKKFDEYKIIHGLDLQLKAVDNKINELKNIKNTLEQSVNEALNSDRVTDYSDYFNKIDRCLSGNKEKRSNWMDKWGFDSWATNYDDSIKANVGGDLNLFENYDLVLEGVSKLVSKHKAEKVIDIGCGTGNLYGKTGQNVEYTGVDQSVEMLLKARVKYPNIKLRLGNFLEEPFIKNEFDVVTSTFAFHHLNFVEKQKAINLLMGYLKIGGTIIIADLMFLNNKERLKEKEYLIQKGREDLWGIIEDEYYTDIEEMKKYAQQLGYKVKYSHIANFTWMLEICCKEGLM